MRKIIRLLVMLSLMMVFNASLVLADDWNDGANCWYSPWDGSVNSQINSSYKMYLVEFSGCKWTSSAISSYDFLDAWELEWRAADGSGYDWDDFVNITPTSKYNSLPGAYYENIDSDDATFGSHSPQNLSASAFYSGYMTFTPKTTQPSSFNMTVESELGYDAGGLLTDPIPADFDILKRYLPKATLYSW